MQFVDHLFIVLLFIVQPIHGWFAFRKVVAAAQAGEPVDRVALYRETTVLEWVALGVLLVTWLLLSRDFANLGLVAPGGEAFWWSLLVCAVVLGYLLASAKKLRDIDEQQRRRFVEQIGDIGFFLPSNGRELRGFYGLSVTAGVVEEIVFRGFVLWYFAAFMPLWAAVLLSSVAFGLAHSYQGLHGIWRTAAVGAAMAVLFVASGSIWLPIVVHALFDVIQGMQARELFRDRNAPTPEAA